MGILNVTPDSFYDGGRYIRNANIKRRVEQMIAEGADIIDIGACSSRPGAGDVKPDEEMRRLSGALGTIRKYHPETLISVDTFRAEVVRMVIDDYEADMVNDISAGMADSFMLETVARYGVPYVMMHMQGKPETMQRNPVYNNLLKDVLTFFSERIYATAEVGIRDVIIDPGFGFGKTLQQNFQLLNSLALFRIFELPVMVGLSRKSMIHKTLRITPAESLNGTAVLNTMALINGASLLRVHDVKEAREAIALYMAYKEAGEVELRGG
jgi:dihydropteroate synthase